MKQYQSRKRNRCMARSKKPLKMQRIVQFALAVLVVLCCGLILFHKTVSTASSENPCEKCYKSIEIQKGDSLWSIAQNYCSKEWNSIPDYIEEVKQFNGLHQDELTAGNYIAIPYYVDKNK